MPRDSTERGGDRGSAVVEFTFVVPLLLVVAFAVIQLALALHVRSTLVAAAAEGARVASLSGGSLAAGEARTRSVLADSVAEDVVRDIDAHRSVTDGVPVVQVTVRARLPLFGLLGPDVVEVSGTALDESALTAGGTP